MLGRAELGLGLEVGHGQGLRQGLGQGLGQGQGLLGLCLLCFPGALGRKGPELWRPPRLFLCRELPHPLHCLGLSSCRGVGCKGSAELQWGEPSLL